MSTPNNITGVVLMTYGSATSAEHVRDFFERIYPGRVTPELVANFENRYRAVGGSPLVEITKQQAQMLQIRLGSGFVVRAGMRHSAPFISEAITECITAGASSLRGIVLSPQLSSFIRDGYAKDFSEAARENGITDSKIAESWPDEQHFVELLAKRIDDKLALLTAQTPVIFTTHSLPQRVVEHDLSYLDQLHQTIQAVRKRLSSTVEWYQGFQSAGHTPEDWLKPDLSDILADLQRKKRETVLIVPIQFLADHLEILYDLDIAARAQCEEFGISYNRIELPNTDPLFIDALASVADARRAVTQ